MRQLGHAHEEIIDRAELRRLVPALSPHCVGALVARRDGAADPHRTLRAFRRCCEAAGATIHEGCGVTAIERHGADWLIHAGERRFVAPAIVNAAGAWAARLAALIGDDIALGMKASMMIVTERLAPLLDPVVSAVGRALSFKQSGQGTLVIGGGLQGKADLDTQRSFVDYRELARGARAATDLFPCVRDVRITRTWAGMEAKTEDLLAGDRSVTQRARRHSCFRFLGPRLSARAGRGRDRLRSSGPRPDGAPDRRLRGGAADGEKGGGMIRYAVKRLLLAIPTLFVMLTAIFVLVRLVPGDAASVILGDQATEASLRALRTRLGLDQPLHVQYLSFIGDVLSGNLGQSLSSGRSVAHEVLLVLPYTIELTLAAITIGVVLGLPFGVAAAVGRNSWVDYASRIVSLVGLSFPAFVSGILLLIVFAIQLGWFPVLNTSGGGALERLRNLALPALNLGIIMMAYVVRVTRSSMLGVLSEDYIRTARAKGVRPTRLIMRHALRNGLIPIITVVGLYFGTLIGNSVLTEIIFNRPGLGKLILGALNARDYTLLQGLMIIFAFCVIVVNTLTDLAYGLVDPRVKYK